MTGMRPDCPKVSCIWDMCCFAELILPSEWSMPGCTSAVPSAIPQSARRAGQKLLGWTFMLPLCKPVMCMSPCCTRQSGEPQQQSGRQHPSEPSSGCGSGQQAWHLSRGCSLQVAQAQHAPQAWPGLRETLQPLVLATGWGWGGWLGRSALCGCAGPARQHRGPQPAPSAPGPHR